MTPAAAKANEVILAKVESFGGGFVWEPEIFAVILIDVAVTNDEASVLAGLAGVQQIAIDASHLSFSTLLAIAGIPALKSLVLSNALLSGEQEQRLAGCGPEVEVLKGEE